MGNSSKLCFPKCQFFRCTQRSILFKNQVSWCNFADDECEVSKCKYSQCVRSRLLPSGVCALTVTIKSLDIEPSNVTNPVKIPPKLARKIKERELF